MIVLHLLDVLERSLQLGVTDGLYESGVYLYELLFSQFDLILKEPEAGDPLLKGLHQGSYLLLQSIGKLLDEHLRVLLEELEIVVQAVVDAIRRVLPVKHAARIVKCIDQIDKTIEAVVIHNAFAAGKARTVGTSLLDVDKGDWSRWVDFAFKLYCLVVHVLFIIKLITHC